MLELFVCFTCFPLSTKSKNLKILTLSWSPNEKVRSAACFCVLRSLLRLSHFAAFHATTLWEQRGKSQLKGNHFFSVFLNKFSLNVLHFCHACMHVCVRVSLRACVCLLFDVL